MVIFIPQPAWLDESVPGTYGFDPAGLAKDKASALRFQEAEVFHGRWAMLGVAGSLGVEVLGFGNWYDAQSWVSLNPIKFQSIVIFFNTSEIPSEL